MKSTSAGSRELADGCCPDELGFAPTNGTRFGSLSESVSRQKSGQNRVHLDLTTASIDDQNETVATLVRPSLAMSTSAKGPMTHTSYWPTPMATSFTSSPPDSAPLTARVVSPT